MDATESGGRAQFAGLRRENVEVFNRNRDDFQRFRRDARFRVVDDGDSDSDDDERSSERSDRDSNNNSDRRSDEDSDRQRGRGGRP